MLSKYDMKLMSKCGQIGGKLSRINLLEKWKQISGQLDGIIKVSKNSLTFMKRVDFTDLISNYSFHKYEIKHFHSPAKRKFEKQIQYILHCDMQIVYFANLHRLLFYSHMRSN